MSTTFASCSPGVHGDTCRPSPLRGLDRGARVDAGEETMRLDRREVVGFQAIPDIAEVDEGAVDARSPDNHIT